MVSVPGDKSISHRALLFGSISSGTSRLKGLLSGEDCRSTASVLRALGVDVPVLPSDGSEVVLRGVGARGFRTPGSVLDCGNSGTTVRLLMGVLAGMPIEAGLDGDASLRSRPMRRVTAPLSQMGARFEELGAPDRLPLRIEGGGLRTCSYASPVSSAQVKSAVLLAGVTAGVPVRVVEPDRSRDHTERMLRRMGVEVLESSTDDGWAVAIDRPPDRLDAIEMLVPGDFSSAAFLLAFGLLRGGTDPLRIENVGLNPTRTGLLDVLRRMGGAIEVENLREADRADGEPAGDLVVSPSRLEGVSVGGEMIPRLIDEIPILAVVGALSGGVTRIRDAEELRVKESDRLRVMVDNLRTVGVSVDELPDGLTIRGGSFALRGHVPVHHDHRIAMAFGVLGALSDHDVHVDDPSVADVSFPGFWELLGDLGNTSGVRGT